MTVIEVNGRKIGADYPPLVIAEIGINHEGSLDKAKRMVDDAAAVGAECVKFQYHVISDEMIPNSVVPGNSDETIWNIMSRCALSPEEELQLKRYVDDKGLIYLSTPFSRAAADELEKLGVPWYKVGSGECNNYPLIRHIAGFGKPVVLSTGMNDLASITPSVEILREHKVPFALLHCTSMYPTPYEKVRLGGIGDLAQAFPDAIVGLSDHSLGNYTSFASIALGSRIVEKHFTSDLSWPGPDVPISLDPEALRDLVHGSKAVYSALGGGKTILAEEQPTIDFAYACVVTTKPVAAGEAFSSDNVWVKRPGTGEIKARDYEKVLTKTAAGALDKDVQLRWSDLA